MNSSWDLLLTDVHLATMAEGTSPFGVVENGALAISGGNIACICHVLCGSSFDTAGGFADFFTLTIQTEVLMIDLIVAGFRELDAIFEQGIKTAHQILIGSGMIIVPDSEIHWGRRYIMLLHALEGCCGKSPKLLVIVRVFFHVWGACPPLWASKLRTTTGAIASLVE